MIVGKRKDDTVVIRVLDDGEGANVEKIRQILDEPSGNKRKEQVSSIGLKNVQERLQLFFGEEYGLKVIQMDHGGLCIEVCLPVQKQMEEERTKIPRESV